MDGPDHVFSLDPKEMKIFKEKIRSTETYLAIKLKNVNLQKN